jgi:hypothetical protein
MSSITDIQLFNALKQKLGEKEAEELVSFVRSTVDEKLDEQIPHLATKEDLANTKVEIIKWVFAFFITMILLIVGLYFK